MNVWNQPLWKKKTERIIIHCGTNDLASEKAPEESIAESIINLTESAKNDKLNEKARKVNVQMKKYCRGNKIHLIDHININSNHHIYEDVT